MRTIEDLGVDAEADAFRGRLGTPWREYDLREEGLQSRGSKAARHVGHRNRLIGSVLPPALEFLAQLMVRRGSREAVTELLDGLDIRDRPDFKPPPDQPRFLDIAARRCSGVTVGNTDNQHLCEWLPRMDPRDVLMAYGVAPGLQLVAGATVSESVAAAAAASSALVPTASGSPVGWVDHVSERGEALVQPMYPDFPFVKSIDGASDA